MSDEMSPAAALHALVSTPAGRDRVCRIVEATGEEGPLALVRAALFAAGLFVPAGGQSVAQFVQILSRFGFMPVPVWQGPPQPGSLYVLLGADGQPERVGFVARLNVKLGQPASESFEGWSAAGEERIPVGAVNCWLRLP